MSFPLNLLGHETLNESPLKQAVVRLNKAHCCYSDSVMSLGGWPKSSGDIFVALPIIYIIQPSKQTWMQLAA